MKFQFGVSLLLLALLLSGCETSGNGVASFEVPTSIGEPTIIGEPYRVDVVRTERTHNCDGLSPSQEFERSLATEQTTSFEIQSSVGGSVTGAPLPNILEAQIDARIEAALRQSLGTQFEEKKKIVVDQDPGTANEHTITWREVKVNGTIDLIYPDDLVPVLFTKTIGLELYERTSQPLSCDVTPIPSAAPSDRIPTDVPQPPPTDVPQPTNTPQPPPTDVPQPTNTPQPPPTQPRPSVLSLFDYDAGVPLPNETTLSIRVNEGEVHAITAGPICLSGSDVCLPGGEDRASVVVLLPRSEDYFITNLVPLRNWHGYYYGQQNHAQQLAQTLAGVMTDISSPNPNCNGGCSVVDIVIFGRDGLIASYSIP